MTSTGVYKGLQDGRNSSKVLKPPGGGSSDIFGPSGDNTTSPRRINKANANASSFGFYDAADGAAAASAAGTPQSNGSSGGGSETPRKPGNDSYKRLFGPPDAPPPCTPKAKLRMQSSISLSGSDTSRSSSASSTQPSTPMRNAHNGSAAMSNGGSNGYLHNDVVDGNPVTGSGYDASMHQNGGSQNGGGSAASSISGGSEKSSSDSSPMSSNNAPRMKNRVPPGGYSSGLW